MPSEMQERSTGDLMVFIDGQSRSVEGIMKIFDEFVGMSGLKISLEKSTLYFFQSIRAE